MKRLILFSMFLFLASLFTTGQELTVLYPGGFANKSINIIDSLDALIENNGIFELKTVMVRVDSGYGASVLKIAFYEIECDKKPVVLFKNHNFKKKNIIGKKFKFKYIEPDSSLCFSLNNKHFKINAYGETIDKGNNTIIKDYKLMLEWIDNYEKNEIEIVKVGKAKISSGSFIEAPRIMWIGDLNDDQFPDLIIEEATHYAVIKRGLYISDNLGKSNYPRTVLVEGGID